MLYFSRIFILSFLFSFSVFAADPSGCCLCQIGDDSVVSKAFYKAGCRRWFRGHKDKDCRKGTIVSIEADLGVYIPKVCKKNQTLKLGYVGHWPGTRETVIFISSILPSLNKHGIRGLDYHNTACLAANQPSKLSDYLRGVKSSNPKLDISVIGSQDLSAGMWSYGDLNLEVEVTPLSVEYPPCKSLVDKTCSGTGIVGWVLQRSAKKTKTKERSGYCKEEDGKISLIFCEQKRSSKWARSKENLPRVSLEYKAELKLPKNFESGNYSKDTVETQLGFLAETLTEKIAYEAKSIAEYRKEMNKALKEIENLSPQGFIVKKYISLKENELTEYERNNLEYPYDFQRLKVTHSGNKNIHLDVDISSMLPYDVERWKALFSHVPEAAKRAEITEVSIEVSGYYISPRGETVGRMKRKYRHDVDPETLMNSTSSPLAAEKLDELINSGLSIEDRSLEILKQTIDSQ